MIGEREKKTSADLAQLVITRVLDAPRDVVWETFTSRSDAVHWWGPRNFTVPELEMDPRPGGRWRAVLRSPDGKNYAQHGVYREIVPFERIAFTLTWDEEGPASEMLCTFTFAERGGRTEMTFRKGPFASPKTLESERDGWNECFDRLAEYIRDRRATSSPRHADAVGLAETNAVANLAVKDLNVARKFYEQTLGLSPVDDEGGEVIVYRSGASTLNVYRSAYAGTNKATAVTWTVGDALERVVRALKEKGITFEHYDMPGMTRTGDIHLGGDMKVAWFKDPDGNILNVTNR